MRTYFSPIASYLTDVIAAITKKKDKRCAKYSLYNIICAEDNRQMLFVFWRIL